MRSRVLAHAVADHCDRRNAPRPPQLGLRVLDGQQGRADGYCVVTDKDGDKIYSVWSCKGPFPGPCDGDNKFTGGTGKYAGITGGNRFQGVTTAPTSSGYSLFMNGTWQLP